LNGFLVLLGCWQLQGIATCNWTTWTGLLLLFVKNWLDDWQANSKPNSDFKQYLKIEKLFAKDNCNLIEEHNSFEELQVDSD
jgi:hypothetical protein